MNDYLVTLQSDYAAYKKSEEQLRSFLEKHMDGDVEGISVEDGCVTIATVERCKGTIYHETYRVPFDFFKDPETFASNLMKFRD
jgi:hypothetical protein